MTNNHSKQVAPPSKGTCARYMYKKYGAESCAQSLKWEKWTSTGTPKLRWPPGGSFETDVMEYLELVLSEQHKTFVDWRAFAWWKVESAIRQKQDVECHSVARKETKTPSSCGHHGKHLQDCCPSTGSQIFRKPLNKEQDSSLSLPSTRDNLEDFTLKCNSLAENFGLSPEALDTILRTKKRIEMILQKGRSALAASGIPERTSTSADEITMRYSDVWKHYKHPTRSEIDWQRVYDCKQLEGESPLTYFKRLDQMSMHCRGFEMADGDTVDAFLLERFVCGLNTKLGNTLKDNIPDWKTSSIEDAATEAEKLHRESVGAAIYPMPCVRSTFRERPTIPFYHLDHIYNTEY